MSDTLLSATVSFVWFSVMQAYVLVHFVSQSCSGAPSQGFVIVDVVAASLYEKAKFSFSLKHLLCSLFGAIPVYYRIPCGSISRALPALICILFPMFGKLFMAILVFLIILPPILKNICIYEPKLTQCSKDPHCYESVL